MKIVHLPLTEPANADFTDYIEQFSLAEFKKLVAETKPETKHIDRPVIIPDKVHSTGLAQASDAKYYFRRVEMDVVISGKDTQPYLPPRIIELKCPMGQSSCKRCGIAPYGGKFEIVLDHLSADILQWIDCSEEHHQNLIRKRMEIPTACRLWKHKIEKAQNVEEVTLIPEINYASQDTEYVVRVAYCIGIGIKSNHNYRLEAVTIPHPKTQYATHLIYRVTDNKTAIDEFKMNEQIRTMLGVFKCV